MMHLGLAALLATFATVQQPPAEDIERGLHLRAMLNASSILGSAGRDVPLGYTFRPSIGYELSNGAAGFVALSYSRWNTSIGLEWQLAAEVGARFTLRRGRWLPWGELALGWGQLVDPQIKVDIGVRSSGALGLDFLATETVRAGVRVGLERIDGGNPSQATFWLDAGFVATFFLL
jgi:hypothetical protein